MIDDSATGRRREEIEITPEMIEAGACELAGFNRENATVHEGAARILKAALEARER